MSRSHTSSGGHRPSQGSTAPSSRKSGNEPGYRKGNGFADEWIDDNGQREASRAEAVGGMSADSLDGSGLDRETADLSPGAIADGIRDAATTTARAVKEQASAIASEVGHELGKTAEKQVTRGAEAIKGFARAIEAAGSELEGQSPQLARYVADAAGRMRDVSTGLGNREVNDIIDAATTFARKQPVAFFGATLAAGFVLARFLKSSAKSDAAPAQMGADSGAGFDRYSRRGM